MNDAMLTMRCAATGATFSLERDGPDNWRVTLRGAGLAAEASVYAYRGETIAEYCAGLARDWRGFDGVRSWASLESELEIDAASDGVGHLAVTVRLILDPQRQWRVEGVLVVEAGDLERLRAEAAAFAPPA
ncbi:MAG: hypothetical protein KDE27_11055 [Planctomycetes bacterium]|nr:hypothetical protein [Planctomycetota bacterium]